MNQLWPRLSTPHARAAFAELASASITELAQQASPRHPRMTFAATGGARVSEEVVKGLANSIREVAVEYGYPAKGTDDQRVLFDRAAAEVVFQQMEITTVEAANRGVWSMLAVVVLPDVTCWRFERTNLERWVASDLTRHMFSRLWWQALTFGVPGPAGIDFSLLRQLTESDLNQITERRSIAGNRRLAQSLARLVIDTPGSSRLLLRDLTPRLRRRLAFVDFSALDDQQIGDQLRSMLA